MNDNHKNIYKNVFISILIFLFIDLFSYILSFLLDIFNISITDLKYELRILIVYLTEIIPLVIIVWIYKNELKEKFKDFKNNFIKYIDKYIIYWLLGLVAMTIFDSLINIFTGSNISNNEQAVREITNILPIYSVLSVCLCAPITEELLYRKTIGNIFKNKTIAIIMSGFLFGLAHVVGTYQNPQDLLYIFSYGVLGSVFMYIYLDSDNIWNTIFIHFSHNTILIIAQLIRTFL